MGLITLTNILVLLIILRFNKTEFKFKKWTDIVSFLVIPVMSVLIIYSCVYISILGYFTERQIVTVVGKHGGLTAVIALAQLVGPYISRILCTGIFG